jgi:hypothetical protein
MAALKREPSAAMRQAAKYIRELYEALLEQGFNEDQALRIVSTSIGTAAGTSPATTPDAR